MQLRNDTRLPDNAVATIQQTSLLGEKFVQLAAPATGASPNPLKTGDIIPLAHTGQNPEVEQVLGALSLLLNGGGVGQLQTITRELNRTLHGREGEARSVLHQIRSFAGQLDRHKQRDRPGAPGARPAVGVAEHAALDDRRHARRAARCAAVDQHPAARPGPDARGARPPERGRRPRDHAVQGLDDRHAAPAEPGPGPAPGLGRATSSTASTSPSPTRSSTRSSAATRRWPATSRWATTPTSTSSSTSRSTTRAACRRCRPACRPPSPRCRPACPRPRSPRSSATWPACLRAATSPARPARRCSPTREELARLITKCKKDKNSDNPVCQVLNALPSLPTGGTGVPTLTLPTTLLPTLLPRTGVGAQAGGVRAARTDPAAAVAALRPDPGQPARPRAGDEPMILRRTKIQLLVFALITLLGVSFVGAKYAQLEPALLLHVVHRGRALPGLRRHVRRRHGLLPRRPRRPGRQAGADPATASTPTSTSTRAGTTRSRPTRSPWSATARPSASSTSTSSRRPTTAPTSTTARRSRRPTPASRCPTQKLLGDLSTTVRSVNRGSLRTTVHELGLAFAGTGPDLQRIIDTGTSFIHTANRNFDVTTAADPATATPCSRARSPPRARSARSPATSGSSPARWPATTGTCAA